MLPVHFLKALGMELASMLDAHLPLVLPLHSMSLSSEMYFTCRTDRCPEVRTRMSPCRDTGFCKQQSPNLCNEQNVYLAGNCRVVAAEQVVGEGACAVSHSPAGKWRVSRALRNLKRISISATGEEPSRIGSHHKEEKEFGEHFFSC